MSRYKDYRAEDFALDEYFQKWVLTPEDQDVLFWNNLLERYPFKTKEINKAIELVRLSGMSTNAEVNAEYLEIWGNLKRTADRERIRKTRKIASYVAVAAAFVGSLIVFLYYQESQPELLTEYQTSYGEIKEITLEDGSTVMLNANSSLKLGNSWMSKSTREVSLEGEAFFNVKRTADLKPFNVKTSEGVTVHVLGTTFNVNTRRESLFVYLQSGKVNIQSESESVTLRPGQRADFDKSLQRVVVRQEDLKIAEDRLAWKDNLYVMNDLSLKMIAHDIEDNFGKQVILMDSTLSTERVTAKLPARDVNLLLKVLTEALDIDIEQKGNQIIIKSHRTSD
jgi:transmembrane sensor